MAVRDRIRLIELLRKSPAQAGFFYGVSSWRLDTLSDATLRQGDFYGIARRGRPASGRQRSTPHRGCYEALRSFFRHWLWAGQGALTFGWALQPGQAFKITSSEMHALARRRECRFRHTVTALAAGSARMQQWAASVRGHKRARRRSVCGIAPRRCETGSARMLVVRPGRGAGGGRPVEWPAVRCEKALRHLMLSEP
jgi:hypothetical protein